MNRIYAARSLVAATLLLSLASCSGGSDSKIVQPVNQNGGGSGAGDDSDKVEPWDNEPDSSPFSNSSRVGNIYFDYSLSRKERGAFEAAMNYLEEKDLSNGDSQMFDYMKISSGDRLTVRQWIEDRVQYIIPDLDKDKLGLVGDYSYENPGVLPGDDSANEEKGKVIMANVGAALYATGKKMGQLISYRADGIGSLRVTSPRSGILMVGEGLFMLPSAEKSVVKIFHLLTLIHEARHSDGHGKTLGFFHAKCVGGVYDGQAACDKNLNGPYGIEALAFKALKNSCTTCTSQRSRKVIDVLYADSLTRTLPGATVWDDAPEGRRE